MKKIVSIAILLLVFASMLCGTCSSSSSPGPAPDSGDGIPEGNGWYWQNPDSPGLLDQHPIPVMAFQTAAGFD